jgi:hypothetical protein
VSVIIFWSSVGQVAGKPEALATAAEVAVDVEETCEISVRVHHMSFIPPESAHGIASHRRSKRCCVRVLTAWSAKRGSIRGGRILL